VVASARLLSLIIFNIHNLFFQLDKFGPPPDNVHTLRRNIERAWEQLPQRHIQRAIAAMHDRMRTCVANGGESVTKWYM
jgi:hypothetical protein